ncbi:hypothetical protein E2320_014718 [Naja naja]|nr:hypothetical protein E2320_014718 [Naja naja]
MEEKKLSLSFGSTLNCKITFEMDPQMFLLSQVPAEEAISWAPVNLLGGWCRRRSAWSTSMKDPEAHHFGKEEPEVKVDVNALLKDIEEYSRQRFRSDALPLGERPWQTLFQLGEAAERWLRPQDRTKGQIVDVVILEQFLHVLPLGMQAWVRARKPSTSQEAAQLAEAYLEQQLLISKPDPSVQTEWEEGLQMANLQLFKGKDSIVEGVTFHNGKSDMAFHMRGDGTIQKSEERSNLRHSSTESLTTKEKMHQEEFGAEQLQEPTQISEPMEVKSRRQQSVVHFLIRDVFCFSPKTSCKISFEMDPYTFCLSQVPAEEPVGFAPVDQFSAFSGRKCIWSASMKASVEVTTLFMDIEEYNRQRFRSDALPLGERPWQTLFQLGEAAERWLRPQDRTKGQIVDVVILEQFLHVLPLGMQAWVRARKPSTSQEAAQLAEAYLEQQLLISKPDPHLQLDWEEVSQMADLQTLKGKDTIDQGIVNFEDLTVVENVDTRKNPHQEEPGAEQFHEPLRWGVSFDPKHSEKMGIKSRRRQEILFATDQILLSMKEFTEEKICVYVAVNTGNALKIFPCNFYMIIFQEFSNNSCKCFYGARGKQCAFVT